jgi:hypothetical protein
VIGNSVCRLSPFYVLPVKTDSNLFPELEMSNFFDESRPASGLRSLILLIKVFNKPHPPSLLRQAQGYGRASKCLHL